MVHSHAPRRPKALVFGTGSLGIIYSMILSRSGVDLSCICRSNYAAAKTNGFTAHSTIFGNENFHPTIYSCVEDIQITDENEMYDFIIVTTKAFINKSGTGSAVPSISPLVSPRTAIVIIQNGIGMEQQYRDQFPNNPIVSCVAYMPTTQTAPGTVHHTEVERLQLGTFPSNGVPTSHHEAVAKFAALIRSGGGTAEIFADVQVARWKKLIGNCSWNPICALSRCRDLEFLQASFLSRDIVQSVMEEIVSVAVAAGYGDDIGLDDITTQMSRSAARLWPGVEPSMLADATSNKPMEVDVIIGEVVRLGRHHKVLIPRLECLYVLISGLSWSQTRAAS